MLLLIPYRFFLGGIMTTFLVLFPLILPAQWLEDFSDDLAQWQGDTADFVVNSQKMLQLDAAEAGKSLIFRKHQPRKERWSWSLDLNLDFSPSSVNRFTWFLHLSDTSLQSSGYLMELGETGEFDGFYFYGLDKGTKQLLFEGKKLYGDSLAVQVEVRYTISGWTVMVTRQSDGMLLEEWSFPDPTSYLESDGYLAIFCEYTETRKDKFRFDNLSSGFDDTIPPFLLSLDVVEPTELILYFDEKIDSSFAGVSNFEILPGPVLIKDIQLLPGHKQIRLLLSVPLGAGSHSLKINGIRDEAGNLTDITYPFDYFPPIVAEAYDLLIHEIFDDPTPVIGLPEAEYIELFCRREGLNLAQIQLVVGSRILTLPERFLHQGEFIVLTDERSVDLFDFPEGVIGLPSMPALLNSGSQLQLLFDGRVIHQVAYNDSWYADDSRSEGGWSLEMVNPNVPCALSENWRASNHLSGGSPGRMNSVFDTSTVADQMRIIHRHISGNGDTIHLTLNKNFLEAPSPAFFEMTGGSVIYQVLTGGSNRNVLALLVDPPLQRGIAYALQIEGFSDCAGVPVDLGSWEFGVPEEILPGDLILNELLFDPFPNGVDFVELWNLSSKFLDASTLRLMNRQNNQVVRISNPQIIEPGALVVVTPDARSLLSVYSVPRPDWLIQNELPTLPDDQGNITALAIVNGETQVLDSLNYESGMHSRLLKDREGVSLERLAPNRPSNDRSNWFSASSVAGFATPTSLNSQRYDEVALNGSWSLSSKTISPDGDGFEDYTQIQYSDIPPGTNAYIRIFESSGHMIRNLVNNQSLSAEGQILWDGTTDNSNRAPIGIYTILIRSVTSSGRVNEHRLTCVVAARLN